MSLNVIHKHLSRNLGGEGESPEDLPCDSFLMEGNPMKFVEMPTSWENCISKNIASMDARRPRIKCEGMVYTLLQTIAAFLFTLFLIVWVFLRP